MPASIHEIKVKAIESLQTGTDENAEKNSSKHISKIKLTKKLFYVLS